MQKTIHIPRGEKREEPTVVIVTEPHTELIVELEDDAKLDMVCIELAPPNATITITQKSTLGRNATLHLRNITLGGGSVTHDVVSHILGEGSESSIDWIFYGKGSEKQQLSARNIFDAPDGRGEMTVHGVAENEARTAFTGFIEITKNGRGTDTFLTEKTLMLDTTAKVDAVPGLEIKTNDVKASHSASVSKVSDEDLFYFASRGISETIARRMYVEGFLGALVQKFTGEKTRELVLHEIVKKYNRTR
jgi:Fe-S cluster assembly scaffold protein SufB